MLYLSWKYRQIHVEKEKKNKKKKKKKENIWNFSGE